MPRYLPRCFCPPPVVQYYHIIFLIVCMTRSAILALVFEFCVVKWYILSFSKYVRGTFEINSEPLSVLNFLHFLPLSKILLKPLTTSFAVLFFRGWIRRYLENVYDEEEMLHIVVFLCYVGHIVPNRHSYWSSIPATMTLAFLIFDGLVYASCNRLDFGAICSPCVFQCV